MERTPCSQIGKLNFVKISIIPKLNYILNTIPIKILAELFVDISKLIQKFMWKGKKTKIRKRIFKKNKVGELTQSDFKTYFKALVSKTL